MNRIREILSPETRALLRSLHQAVELETQIKAILQHFETIQSALIAAVSLQICDDADLYAAPVDSFGLSPPSRMRP